ncbi:probable Fmp41p [Saccharomycodes ludwigii]|uniref:Probable Fmp41p n=1 Tax=Saccharomycodes ludwigii TaxID=36035 RepID=A0A376B995_9ASCO|nr:hypothetical protein SCDLUD_002956 [Saccharomycodes ludwigii]KAH3901461.1 hypothetical protein SCDLUD_002956 [Saccharomycodes ludwigii]SSD61104.1 probable Fmp41p [Saccharomycodes ludwigii]
MPPSFDYLLKARKVICIGRNYAAHIKELNNATPKQPFFFLKPTSSIITPPASTPSIPSNTLNFPRYPITEDNKLSTFYSFHGLDSKTGANPSPIYIPQGVTVHHEVELALVVDDYLSNIPENVNIPIHDVISGVSLALDLTARNVQNEAKAKGLPWSIGKGFDTFLPISEFISKDKLSNTVDFQKSFDLKCSVNGQLRQNGNTGLMLNSMSKILQHISIMISLEPGDIVLTGTPAGVGELNPNDTINAELYQDGKLLTSMEYDCVQKPGPYVYKET